MKTLKAQKFSIIEIRRKFRKKLLDFSADNCRKAHLENIELQSFEIQVRS